MCVDLDIQGCVSAIEFQIGYGLFFVIIVFFDIYIYNIGLLAVNIEFI